MRKTNVRVPVLQFNWTFEGSFLRFQCKKCENVTNSAYVPNLRPPVSAIFSRFASTLGFQTGNTYNSRKKNDLKFSEYFF
jgi:hypothetical protein